MWIRTKSDEAAVDAGCYFDIKAADRVRTFFHRFIRHSKGQWAGKPFELLDWQWSNVIAPLFGWKRPDGSRRFRKAGIEIGKKNGKSAMLSAIALYMLVADREPGAEVYTAAADRGQASIIFNESASMIRASPALLSRLKIIDSKKLVTYPEANSIYQALSSDVPTKDGLNIHCLLFDELHTQKTYDLWNALRYGGAARRQPLLLWISTAGYDRTTLCYNQVEYARDIQASRTVDTSFMAYVCEAEESDDWTKEETWKKANPSYGITMNAEDFASDCAEAQKSPLMENAFKRLRLNLWTQQSVKWIGSQDWNKCRRKITEKMLLGKPCRVGIDLATVTDVASAVLLFRTTTGFAILPYFWIPRDTLKKRERENRTKLDAWIKYIKVTPGPVIDYDIIRKDINALAKRFAIKDICIDPWNATQIATQLMTDGFKVEFVRCGFPSLNSASKEFEKLVLQGTLQHNGNPVMDWMVGNVTITQDPAGNIKPDKAKSTEKIDGVVACILALAKELTDPSKPSVYEDRGIEFI